MTTINPSSSLASKNSQRISFPLGFSTICALVPVKMWRNAETGTGVTFLVFTALLLSALCVYLNTAIVNHHNMGSGGQTQRRKLRLLVYICVICNRLSNPIELKPSTQCRALKILLCGARSYLYMYNLFEKWSKKAWVWIVFAGLMFVG